MIVFDKSLAEGFELRVDILDALTAEGEHEPHEPKFLRPSGF